MLERCMGMCLQMADEVAECAMVNQMIDPVSAKKSWSTHMASSHER